MKHIAFKILVWILSEIFLNVLGIDDLADYSEWIFNTEAYSNSIYTEWRVNGKQNRKQTKHIGQFGC